VSLKDALPIARQIAEALEAAHDQGIIHRDLKPANVKVRDDGLVKVLDFGLAKALAPEGARATADMANSPTLTARSTQMGMILGTAAYMAPEQARGRAVDRRADIWAFGAVLYEMLTGRRAFEGDDVSITMAAVLKDDVNWSVMPAAVPAALQRLLRRCLEKDPKRRLQAIGEARIVIDDLLNGSATDNLGSQALASSRPSKSMISRPWMAAAGGVLVGVAVTTAVLWRTTHHAPAVASPSARFIFAPSTTQPLRLSPFDRMIAISPDGSHVVAQVASTFADQTLSVRPIDQLDAVALAGTQGARSPFISPDGKWIGYFRGTAEIRKISIAGGPSSPICKVTGGGPRGAVWGPDDTIIFATVDPTTGLLSVPAAGGEPRVLTKPDNAHGELDHSFPSLLPGGRGILFTITSSTQVDGSQIAVFDPKAGRYKTLIRGVSQPVFVGPPDRHDDAGYLVYGAGGSLRAVRFDLDRLEVSGDSVPVLDHVAMVSSGAAEFSTSTNGSLAYVLGTLNSTPNLSLSWVNRHGTLSPVDAPPRAYYSLALSPDGERIALDIRDQENDVWTWDVARETLTRLTFGPAADGTPVWSPDGRRIAFASQRKGPYNVYWQAADGSGSAQPIAPAPQGQLPASFSADGRQLVIQELATGLGVATIGSNEPSKPLLHQQFESRNGVISPDGHFIAYESNESGQYEVYVRPFPNIDGGRWKVSRAGG
jgi:serine/threonine-protein kinase